VARYIVDNDRHGISHLCREWGFCDSACDSGICPVAFRNFCGNAPCENLSFSGSKSCSVDSEYSAYGAFIYRKRFFKCGIYCLIFIYDYNAFRICARACA